MTNVRDVMSKEVIAVDRETSASTAARLLTAMKISGAPVVDAEGTTIGVVSLADLANPDGARSQTSGYPVFYYVTGGEVVPCGDDVTSTEGIVADVMSPFVLSIAEESSIRDAARLMLTESVHRLLVLTGGKLVGIVTMTDLLRAFVADGATAGEAAVLPLADFA